MNLNLFVHRRLMVGLSVLALLSACGGGSDNLFALQDAGRVSGTAASGRPIEGGTVTLKDAAGHSSTRTTRSDGSYSFDDVPGFVWPVVARVEGGILACGTRTNCTPEPNTQRYVGVSVGSRAKQNTLNLTPMSHAVVTASAGFDANGLFDVPLGLLLINPLDLIDATFTVLGWLARLDPEALLPRDIDFVGGVFVPVPGDPQDAVLEALQLVFTTLLLGQPQFGLLVLTDPHGGATPAAPLYCDVAGSYEGGYAGTRQGSWSATVDAYTGLVAGSAVDGGGGASVPGVGSVVRLGLGAQRASAAVGFAGLAQFAGGIGSNHVFSGGWTSPAEAGGSFTGTRTGVPSACR